MTKEKKMDGKEQEKKLLRKKRGYKTAWERRKK